VKQIFKGRTGHSRKESDPDPFVGQVLEVLNWTLGLHFATKNPKNSNNLTFSKKHISEATPAASHGAEELGVLLAVASTGGLGNRYSYVDYNDFFAMNMFRIQMAVS
jgi:hypothetical protein